MVISFPIMCFLVLECVSDTNYFTEDVVIPPDHMRLKAETTTTLVNKLSRQRQSPSQKEQEKDDSATPITLEVHSPVL